MQNSALDPQNSFFDSLTVFFTGNNPRNRKMKPEDLPSLDMQRVLQIYKDRFADFTDFTFVIVGSFDEKQLKNLCTKYLANLPAKGRKESFRDTGGRFTKGKQNFNVYLGQDEKSTVFFTVAEYMQTDRNTSFELNSLSYLIDEKLRENIREARSGVYYIGTWTEINDYPVQHITVNGYMQCAPERVDELSLATYQTLDSLKAGLFEEKYVNVVKMTLQKRFETSIRENRWWLDNIAVQTRKGYPINELLADRNPQNRITYKTLKDAAIKYLLHDVNLLSGVLYPAVLKP
ncbi:MAG: insulinase family protein [Candidatus Cloacimonetes bacterium]|nr:insulinase family protein [Candidatus Cloacimonadota bacterium]